MALLLLIAVVALIVPLVCGVILLAESKRGGRGHPACGNCCYNVSATLEANKTICPECGEMFANVGVMPAYALTNRTHMLMGVFLIAASAISCGNIAIFMPVYNAYLRMPPQVIIQPAPTAPAAPGPLQPQASSSGQGVAPATPPLDPLPSPESLGEREP